MDTNYARDDFLLPIHHAAATCAMGSLTVSVTPRPWLTGADVFQM